MTKKLLSIALAALMVLALAPMSVFANAIEGIIADRTPVTADEYEVWPGSSVTFSGATALQNEPTVGSTFDWTFDISEDSMLGNALWLIDYDEEYLECTNISFTWSNGIYSQINAQWDDDEPTSDKFEGSVNPNYTEDGNKYAKVNLYTTTFDFGGITMGGPLFRFKFKWTNVPEQSTTIPVDITTVSCVLFGIEDGEIVASYSYEHLETVDGSIEVTIAGPEPTATPTPEPTATPEPTPEPTPVPEHSVTYTGETRDEGDVKVGDKFYWTMGVSEESGLGAGHWLMEYDSNYLTCINQSATWSGGIQSLITATWDDEEPYSDKPSFVATTNYQGNTGENPVGEEGHIYNVLGMYLTTFEFNGVQMGGPVIRFQFQWTAVPGADAFSSKDDPLLGADDGGNYLLIPITVLESKYAVTDNGTLVAMYPHSNVNTVDGKIYIELASEYTLTIVYQYADGTEAKPTYTETMAAGTEYSVASPEITGYTADKPTVSGTLNENTTVVVTYNVNQYTITYYVDNVSVKVDTYNYGATVTPYTYTAPEGYTFSGWTETIPATMPAQNLEIHGTTTVNEYTITYYVDNVSVKVDTYNYGATVTPYEYTAPEGYTFSGWTETIPATMPAQNLEIHGTTTVNSYTITYTVNGETYTTQTYEYGAA
ncbi:MAG: InlB B-repeat-containing protein, partial [Clostridia bacterium]|nr:InlB B-repeat-containing protein [Clostridia bacterium]